MKKIYFLMVMFLLSTLFVNAQSPSATPCSLQIHLERTIGASTADYSVYIMVNDDWYSRELLVLDASTASKDTTLLLLPSTPFELWTSSGGSDFRCRITDGSGGVFEDYYYPNYKTMDPCSPACNLEVMYGSDDTLLNISDPHWITVYAGNNYYNSWWSLYYENWTAVGHTYGQLIPVTAGVPLRFVWIEPDEANHNSFFTIRDNATGQEIFTKSAGEVLPNGEFLVYTPTCGTCAASDRCPLTIHLSRNANDADHPGDYAVNYIVGGGDNVNYDNLPEIRLEPSESSKDTVLMLCPEVPFELFTKYENGTALCGPDFEASFENAYGNITYSGYYPSYSTEDPCAKNCEYAILIGATNSLSNVGSSWIEVFEGNSTTPYRTAGPSNYTSGTYWYSIPVLAGKQYRFVWHEPDQTNHSTYFTIQDQDNVVLFEKTSGTTLPDGQFYAVTPTCQVEIVTTDQVTEIQPHSALCGGTVNTDAITNYNINIGIDYGICYGTTSNPTVSGAHSTVHSQSNGTFSFSHTMPNLEESTTYYVRAYAAYQGDVYYGDVMEFSTTQAVYCQTPSTVSASGITGNEATITWQVDNVTMPINSYFLQYKKVSDENWTEVSSITDMQYVLTGLQALTTYYVRVRSACESNSSDWKTISFTTAIPMYEHLYVTTDGSGDGSSWSNAMSSLSSALKLAASVRQLYHTTVTIWVAAGTYYGNVDSLHAFRMYDGVNVYGGFAGNEPDNYDLSLRDFNTNATILDGQNSRRVLYQEGNPTQTVIWDGLTIQNGLAMTSSGDWGMYGGGALLTQGFEMRNCRFFQNQAFYDGGALLLRPNVANATLKFQNCEFSHNQSDDGGGAVSASAYTFNNNNMSVDTLDLNLVFDHCDFLYNNSEGGSAVKDYSGMLKFYNCKFKYNSAVFDGDGAIYESTIEGGRTFINCEISHNKANRNAGLTNSRASLLNCSIVNNEDLNSSSTQTSGLYNFRGTLTNCVVWGNKVAGESRNIYSSIYGYDQMFIVNSAIEGGFNFEGNPNNSVITLESENYGSEAGKNYPFFASPGNGDYRLRSQSALVNAGLTYPGLPEYDLAGNDRVYGSTIDIGCYEYQGEDYCIEPVYIAAQDIYGTSATITWQNDNPEEPLYYELSYKQENESTWTLFPEQIHAHYVMLTGLQPQTAYRVRMRAFCDAEHTSEYSSELNFTTSCTNGYIRSTILNAENNSWHTFGGLPLDENYSYSQQIFTMNELGSAGTIDTIYLQHDQTTQVAVRNVDIYMAHTLKSSFDNKDDWFPHDRLTLVYSGNLTVDCDADDTWIAIPLQNSFDYNGVNNLILVIDDNTGNHINYYRGFRSHETDANTTINTDSWNSNIDPTSLPTADYLRDECLNIIFAGACASDGCDRANISVMDVTPTTATLVFTQGTNATACEMQYREVGSGTFTTLPTTSSPYLLQGLTQNTEYEVRARSICSSGQGTWKSIIFRTDIKRLSKLYVTTTGTGDGSSWAEATNDLLWALDIAELMKQNLGTAPDIWVAEGTYFGDTEHSDAFFMKEGVNVYGGFAGNEPEDYDLSLRDFDLHPSILDGQQQRRVLNQREAFVERTIWDGFTIQHGYLAQYEDYAAGAYLRGKVSLQNCVITNNNGAYGEAGGLYCYGNSHWVYGQGYLADSVYIRNCVISHNNGRGATLNEYVLAENCVFEYNTTEHSGGGLILDGATLRNSIVRHNTAHSEYGYGNGGGVYLDSDASLINCEITHNTADKGGGVYDESYSNNYNHKYDDCGIANCLIANNTAKKGGGIYSISETRVRNTTIVNNEIVSNDEEDMGAGILGSYNVTLTNCIIWGNKRNGTTEGYVKIDEDNLLEANHVASDDAIPGEHNILLLSESYANGLFSPHFAHPAEGVGATDATANVDWRLLQGSPCINKGDTTVVGTTDLDGNARVQQDTVDLGCYESAYNSVILPALPDSIVYVTVGGAGNGIGDSWENAMSSLAEALNIAALNRARVWVAAGTYYGDDPNSDNAFVMKAGVNVYGGFAGNEPPTFSVADRDFEQNVTILDGQEQQRVLYQRQDFVAADSAVWDGFTIQNGRTTGNGAGVYMRMYSRLKNCIVQNNVIEGYGQKYGQGIYARNDEYTEPEGWTRISHCKILNNGEEMTSATIIGGGLYANKVRIDHTEIAHNAATNGGGIYAEENVNFSNCLIQNNKATSFGGGLYAAEYNENVRLVNCDIVNNKVANINGGGGLYNRRYYVYDDDEDTLKMQNCIVWGNKFEGVDNNWQSPTFQEEVSIANNIVQYQNTDNTSMKYCAVEDGHNGTGNIMLAPENDKFNGEQLYVRFMDPVHENFHLHPLSACVNMGSNAFVDADLDYYGNMRIQDTLVDIGCAEAGEMECLPVTSVTITVDCDSVELRWNRVFMENQWLLSYGEVGAEPTTILLNDTVHTIYDLPEGKNYTAFVRSICSPQQQSDPSSSANFRTPQCHLDTIVCTPVPSMTAEVRCDSVILRWNRGEDEGQWLLSYRDGTAEPAEPTELTVNDTVYTLKNLTDNHNYTAYVFAICNDTMVSDTSVWVNFVAKVCTQWDVCPATTGLYAKVTCDSVTLGWTNNNDVDRWIISYGEAGQEHIEDTVNTNIRVLRNLPLERTYTVSVCALCNDTMRGEMSPLYTFQTQCLEQLELPNLHVTEITNSTPYILSPMTVTWTVKNDGSAETSPGATWKDFIWLSSVSDVGGHYWVGESSIMLDTVRNLQALEPGESYTNSVTVNIPEGYHGTYYLFVFTDVYAIRDIDYTPTGDTIAPDPYTPSLSGNPYPYLSGIGLSGGLDGKNQHQSNLVQEEFGKEFDNFFYKVITIMTPPEPDLVVTSVTHPTDVFSGNEFPLTYTVKNIGSQTASADHWTDKIYMSKDSLLSMDHALLVGEVEHHGTLSPDSIYSETIQVSIPITYSGDYHFYVYTDQSDHVFESVGEGNNLYMSPQTLHVTLAPYPDLVITAIDMPTDVSANEEYDCRVTVTNMGFGPNYENDCLTHFYLTQGDTLPNNNPIKASSNNIGTINPGESHQFATRLKIPFGIHGAWNLFVHTNSDHGIYENEGDTNNVSMITLNVIPPDLTVTQVTIPDTAWSGSEIIVSYTLKNVSGGIASAPSDPTYNMKDFIYFGASQDSYANGEAIAIGSHRHRNGFRLEVGEEHAYTDTVRIPNGTEGPGYIFVVCNEDEILFENHHLENNVMASGEITTLLTPWPDIRVTSFTVPEVTYLGSPFTVEYTLRNDGIAPLNHVGVIQAFIPSNFPAVYNPMGDAVAIRDTLTLAVGEEVTKTAEITMDPNSFSEGFYFLHMLADADGNVYEYTGENNNYLISSQYEAKLYALDLAIMEIEGPDTVKWGDTVAWRLHVQNLSDLPSIDTLWEVLYLSDNHDYTSNHSTTIFKRCHASSIPANAEYWLNVECIVPFGSPSTSYLLAYLDKEHRNPDIDPSNNQLIKTITINPVPVPDLAIMDVVFLDEIYCGQPARLVYKVKNTGEDAVINQSWNDKFTDYGLELYTNAKVNMTLNPGEYYIDTVDITYPIPRSGNRILNLTVNQNEAMFESSRANNIVRIPAQVHLQSPSDLIVTHVSSDDTAILGRNLHVQWNVENVGTNPMQGSGLRTLVYISTDTLFDAGDRLLGSLTTGLDLAVGASVEQSLDARVSGLSLGEYYLIVKTDVNNAFHEVNDNNNSAFSAQPFVVAVRPLPFNTDVPDTLVNNQVSDFMLTVGENTRQTVRIHLHSEDSLQGAVNQIYATHNQIGDNLNYSYSTISQYTANPELYIPYTMQGYYGVNIYGYTPSENSTQNTVVRADILPFSVMAVNADHGGNTGVVTVELTGSRFRPDMKVCLRNEDDTICADTLIYESYYHVFVRFNLEGKTPGVYDVSALNFCEGEAVLHDGFTIENESPYSLGYDLIIPEGPRHNRSVVMTLEFGNIGNVDLHNQTLVITSNGGCPIALTPEDVHLNQKVLQIPLSIEGEPEGLLRPGVQGSIKIYTFSSNALLFSIKPLKSVE